ncbi:MAG: preprotein translocase subunit SecE [Polyangiaceae bacterium]
MAKQVDNEEDETGEEERPVRSTRAKASKAQPKAPEPPPTAEEEDESEEDEDGEEEESDESDESSEGAADEVAASADDAQAKLDAAAAGDTEGEAEEEVAAGQLGIGKYVFSAYLGCGFLLAFVLGKTLHDTWAHFANRDWFTKFSAKLAGIPDTDNVFLNKSNISFAIGGLIALAVMIRTYRKPSTRQWTDDVTSEIVKVRWPTRKEVANSTIVVVAASLAATGYLFVLDRLWSFITNLVYGSGT